MATEQHNPFDKSCQRLIRHDPEGMISWLLGLAPSAFIFRRWLDTRQPVAPDESDLTRDNVAHLERVDEGQKPWAVLFEFQTEPHHLMFARSLSYLPHIWINEKPDDNPGSRFELGVVVINLTGRGNASRDMEWPQAGLRLTLSAREWNLGFENAEAHLQRVEAGELTRCMLPFIVLMQGGDNPDIIQRWMIQAQLEPDEYHRGDLGALALVLAELTNWTGLWKDALKGWNMKTSQQVQEWQQEAEALGIQKGEAIGIEKGEVKGISSSLLKVLRKQFGNLPSDLITSIESQNDASILDQWLTEAIEAESLDAFRTATQI